MSKQDVSFKKKSHTTSYGNGSSVNDRSHSDRSHRPRGHLRSQHSRENYREGFKEGAREDVIREEYKENSPRFQRQHHEDHFSSPRLQKTQLFPIEVDVLERLKKEAHYKRVALPVLINQQLREKLFSSPKKFTEQLTFKKCPQCGFSGNPSDKRKTSGAEHKTSGSWWKKKNPISKMVQFVSKNVGHWKKKNS
jgi:hypothetical protein